VSTQTEPSPARGASSASGSSSARQRKGNPRTGASLLTALTWILAIGFFSPVLWMVLTSFKQESAAASNPPVFFFSPTLDQYRAVLDAGAGSYFVNSMIATGVSTLLVVIMAVPASYALSIRPVKKTSDVLFFFISTPDAPGSGGHHAHLRHCRAAEGAGQHLDPGGPVHLHEPPDCGVDDAFLLSGSTSRSA
jgi:sorbitol/mannitol transport system permease protein